MLMSMKILSEDEWLNFDKGLKDLEKLKGVTAE